MSHAVHNPLAITGPGTWPTPNDFAVQTSLSDAQRMTIADMDEQAAGRMSALIALSLQSDSVTFEQLIQTFFNLWSSLRSTAHHEGIRLSYAQFYTAVEAAKEQYQSAFQSGLVTLVCSGVGFVAGTAFIGVGASKWLMNKFGSGPKAGVIKPDPQADNPLPVGERNSRQQPDSSRSECRELDPRRRAATDPGDSRSADPVPGTRSSDRGAPLERRSAPADVGRDRRAGDPASPDDDAVGGRSGGHGGPQADRPTPNRADREDREDRNNTSRADRSTNPPAASPQPPAGPTHHTQNEISSVVSGLLMYVLPNCGQGAGQLAGASPQEASEKLRALSEFISQLYQSTQESSSSYAGSWDELARTYASLN